MGSVLRSFVSIDAKAVRVVLAFTFDDVQYIAPWRLSIFANHVVPL